MNLKFVFVDIFWDEPDLERIYKTVWRGFDIRTRTEVIEKRLMYTHDLVEVCVFFFFFNSFHFFFICFWFRFCVLC